MAKGIMVVESNPVSPEREAEYNEFYDNVHLGEVCDTPGIVSARRYKLHDGAGASADPSRPQYLAIYELEGDDLGQVLKALRQRGANGEAQKKRRHRALAGARDHRVRSQGVGRLPARRHHPGRGEGRHAGGTARQQALLRWV